MQKYDQNINILINEDDYINIDKERDLHYTNYDTEF